MNKHNFMRRVIWPTLLYFFVIGLIITLKPEILPREFISIFTALLVTWIGYCIQRRLTYLKNIRELWPKIVVSVEEAIFYTHPSNNWEHYRHEIVLKGLSIVIEEARAVFRNIKGLYPLESLKTIRAEVDGMGPRSEETCPERVRQTHEEIITLYKKLRGTILAELTLETPINADTLANDALMRD